MRSNRMPQTTAVALAVPRPLRHMMRWLLSAAVLGSASGCTVVPPAQEVDIYPLPATALEATAGTREVSLKIRAVESSDALNNRRLLVTTDGASLRALPGARWASPVRSLVRNRLVETMSATGRLQYVTSDANSLSSDYELHTTLRDFVGDYTGAPVAYIRLAATLTDPATRRVLASREFTVRTPAGSRSAADLVAAFGEATDRLALDLTNWIANALPVS